MDWKNLTGSKPTLQFRGQTTSFHQNKAKAFADMVELQFLPNYDPNIQFRKGRESREGVQSPRENWISRSELKEFQNNM